MNALNLFGWRDDMALDRLRQSRSGRIELVPVEDLGFGPRGLLVRDPYASQLLDGEKVWEIRGRPTQIRGLVAIVKSGTGRVFGTVNLARVLGPLQLEDLTSAPELPAAERDEFEQQGLPYEKTYAYVLTNPRWFDRPIPYSHPSGAVTWVRLPDLDLEAVRYADAPLGVSQPRLV